jgi:hypothetical protein
MSPLYYVPVTLMLIVCGSLTFHRLNTPVQGNVKALEGKARAISVSGIFLTLGYLLLIPPVYGVVDQMMPTTNGTDLLSKYLSLMAVALLGGHLSRAYGSVAARRWTVGGPGAIALGLAASGLLWCLATTNAPEQSPQLAAYADQPSARLYVWFMLAYVAYIVFPLIKPAYLDSRRNPLRVGRIASGFIAAGFAMSFIRALTYPLELAGSGDLLHLYMLASYVSTALVVGGLALFAYARRTRKPQAELGRSALSID